MEIIEIINVAKDSLFVNKIRSVLTMIGIIIGVSAVILLVSIGEGARREIYKELGELGSNILIVVPGKTSKEGGMHMGTSVVRKITYDEARFVEKRAKNIIHAVPVIVGTSWIKYKGKSRDTYIVGVTDPYFGIRNLNIEIGRSINTSDVDSGQKVCVLGKTVKKEIIGDANPLGAVVSIGDTKYRVIGIMAPKGMALGFDIDDVVFIPTTAAMELFDTDRLFNITVKVRKAELVDEAKKEIREILVRRHANKEDFTILSQDEMIAVMGKILNIMTAVLAGIATISLIVGGIGIMNIMLVSVKERTREIGIRKAVGAKNRDVLLQFLAESVILSVIGGIGGIILGIALSVGLHYFFDFLPTHITWWSIVVAFLFSGIIGIFFGVYPARKASLYDPIVALRYE
ncbi:MAG: ABC transporter permease [Nitrospirae bacterium]|nr:ABC transporter permease [Nitrospirota bacterium]MCL5062293.1 ABC transporter permease [Nitrospirota bacterium]MDA8338880.1 ABC transporter permease [Nitrospiraceae bacterium]